MCLQAFTRVTGAHSGISTTSSAFKVLIQSSFTSVASTLVFYTHPTSMVISGQFYLVRVVCVSMGSHSKAGLLGVLCPVNQYGYFRAIYLCV